MVPEETRLLTAAGRQVLQQRNDYGEHTQAMFLHMLRSTERRVTALVPAHNEETGIGTVIEALLSQTRRPDKIIVICDNCTDRTEEVARSYGVRVYVTQDNTYKKAGALNQVLTEILPRARDDDFIAGFDADSYPGRSFIENAIRHLDRKYSAVGATFHGRPGGGVLGTLQRAEFARFAGYQHRRPDCDVLSGTGWVIPVSVLREVAALHEDGGVYDVHSLVEDFTLTLEIKQLGYRTVAPHECRVVTDVMETVKDWVSQRLRWQHGTLEVLYQHGWRSYTWQMITRQVMTYSVAVFTPLVLLYMVWSFWLFGWQGINPLNAPLYMLGVLFVVGEQAWESRKAGWKAVVLTLLLIPDFVYSVTRQYVYFRALYRALRKKSTDWGAGTSI